MSGSYQLLFNFCFNFFSGTNSTFIDTRRVKKKKEYEQQLGPTSLFIFRKTTRWKTPTIFFFFCCNKIVVLSFIRKATYLLLINV